MITKIHLSPNFGQSLKHKHSVLTLNCCTDQIHKLNKSTHICNINFILFQLYDLDQGTLSSENLAIFVIQLLLVCLVMMKCIIILWSILVNGKTKKQKRKQLDCERSVIIWQPYKSITHLASQMYVCPCCKNYFVGPVCRAANISAAS